MTALRALSAAGCFHCRASILKLFVSASPVFRSQFSTTWRCSALQLSLRSFSSVPDSDNQKLSEPLKADVEESLDRKDQQQETQPENGDIPWYLRVEEPRHAAATEPAPLPEAPQDGPPLIGSLIDYAAEEMGLDDLLILDLRELDPPAALGPNLFMLFGTARSERHLHVAAGRLVRWLRVDHHIHAAADGLLGPNERKKKLKRKAKRAKLLGTMGVDDADDGITTGWICVNLGTIDGGSEGTTVVSQDGRFAGFGVPQRGSTVIFQVMTESRRAELGLEILWQNFLERQLKQSLPTEDSTPNNRSLQEHAPHSLAAESAILAKTRPKHPFGGKYLPGQTRSFSTGRSHGLSRQASSQSSTADADDPLLSDVGTLAEILATDGQQKQRLMKLLLLHLERLSPQEVLPTLNSEKFKSLSQLATQNLPSDQTWDFRLALEANTRLSERRDHHSLDGLEQLVTELRLGCLPISREQALQLLACIYSSAPTAEYGLGEQTRLALQLLESLLLRGQSIVANDVIVTITEAISWHRSAGEDILRLQKRLEELMVQAKLPYMGEALLMRLLAVYRRQKRWAKFWDVWRVPPRYLQRRSEAMYLHTLRLAASSWSPAVCADALRRCVHEMMDEDPPVLIRGEIREAILQCIRVADHKAEALASLPEFIGGKQGIVQKREFVRLFRDIKKMG